MKKAILIFCCVVSLVMLAGCKSSASSLPEPSTEKVQDRKEVITIKDTVFIVKEDKSNYQAYIDCVNGKPVITTPKAEKGNYLKKPKVTITGNKLEVDCEAEAQKLFHQWKETYVQDTITTSAKIPYAVKTPLTSFQIVQIWFGRVFMFLLLAFIIAVVLRYKKII